MTDKTAVCGLCGPAHSGFAFLFYQTMHLKQGQHFAQRHAAGEELAVGGGFDPPGLLELLHPGNGGGVFALYVGKHGLKRSQPLGGARRAHSSFTPAASQAASVSWSHRLTCTSPTWALPKRSIQSRLWPMPPPIVSGSLPSSSI